MSLSIHKISHVYDTSCTTSVGGREVIAIPEPYTAGRLKAAWAVLTGRAFAFEWPKPGDLEKALHPARIVQGR